MTALVGGPVVIVTGVASGMQYLAAILAGNTTLTVISKKWSQTDIRMTVRWLQCQLLGAFRAGVGADAMEISR